MSYTQTDVEIILMDAEFSRLCVIRAFTSLKWTERYYDDGEFELHIPHDYLKYAVMAAYVYRKDKLTTGVIMTLRRNEDGITLTGGFLETLLKRRAVYPTVSRSGSVQSVCRGIVSDFCMTGKRAIKRLALGEYHNFDKTISVQQEGGTVYEVLRGILSEQEASFRLRFDIPSDTAYFDIFMGIDRTAAQFANDWRVFSREYHNVFSADYGQELDTRNYCYVAGEKRVNSEAVTVVEEVDNVAVGAERRELYIEARDIRKDDAMSDAAFRALLRERGLQKLVEYNVGESIEIAVDWNRMAHTELTLGDKCTYRDTELGITAEGRITEIDEVIEGGEISTNVILGKEQLNLIQKIKREAR